MLTLIMIKIFSLMFIVFSLQIRASDFTYISFFESNKPQNIDDLLSQQGKDLRFLDRYSCSIMRDELFALDLPENLNEDSLKVSDKEGNIFTYKHDLNSRDVFVAKAIRAIQKMRKNREGRVLIKKLMRSPYTLTIKSGGNRFDPRGDLSRPMMEINEAGALITFITKRLQVDRLPFKKWGTGGIVFWDSNKEYEAMESDGKVRGTPTFIALAHELYHAYDSIRGLLDRRMIKGEGYEFQPVIEYRAVFFENMIRKHHGRLYRKYYSAPNKSVIGSMLDPQGRPRWIDTDCYRF